MTEQEYEALEGSTWEQRWHGSAADEAEAEVLEGEPTASHSHDCAECAALIIVSLPGDVDCAYCEGQTALCGPCEHVWLATVRLPDTDDVPF